MSEESWGGWRGEGNVRIARGPGVTSFAKARFWCISMSGRSRNTTPRVPVRMTINFGGCSVFSGEIVTGAGDSASEGRAEGLRPAMSLRSLISSCAEKLLCVRKRSGKFLLKS